MSFTTKLTGKLMGRVSRKETVMLSCSVCGREFQRNRKADLQRHMRIHSDEKPFVCPYPQCGKAFRQSSALKNHSNFHVRDKAFTCESCNMNFFDKPTFNRHIREKHELAFVFACGIKGCEKTFKRKPVFKSHMQDKHGIRLSDEQAKAYRAYAASRMSPTPLKSEEVRLFSQEPPKISSRSHATSFLTDLPEAYSEDKKPIINAAPPLYDAYPLAAPVHPAYPPFSLTNSGMNMGLAQDMNMKTYAPELAPNQIPFGPAFPSEFWLPEFAINDSSYFGAQFFNGEMAGYADSYVLQPIPHQMVENVIDPRLSSPLSYSPRYEQCQGSPVGSLSPALSSRSSSSSSSSSFTPDHNHASRSPQPVRKFY